MADRSYTLDEIAHRGSAIYERNIRPYVQRDHHNEIVVIDIESGDYELSPDHLTAATRAREKHPGSTLFAVKVGYPALARIR